MQTFNIHDAKTQFSKLVDAASGGEEIIIARAGKPAAKLVPISAGKPSRKPGRLKGKLRVAEDFDAPLPADLQSALEGI
jgi:prevent-host-death family protein